MANNYYGIPVGQPAQYTAAATPYPAQYTATPIVGQTRSANLDDFLSLNLPNFKVTKNVKDFF